MTTINKRKVFCFLGLPGSGKGTQIEKLLKRLDARLISIGEEIRDELENADMSDPFYQKMKKMYDEGIPQPDEIAIDIVKNRMIKDQRSIIFDNFPFSHNQADLFFKICKEIITETPVLVIIDITPETSVKRVVYRKVCADCGHVTVSNDDPICEKCGGAMISRSDDNVETVENRIKNYIPRITEVKNYFQKHGIVQVIDGSGTVDQVDALIREKIC